LRGGTLQEAGAEQTKQEDAAQEEAWLAPGKVFYVVEDVIKVILAEIVRGIFDLVGGHIGIVGSEGRALILLVELLPGLAQGLGHAAKALGSERDLIVKHRLHLHLGLAGEFGSSLLGLVSEFGGGLLGLIGHLTRSLLGLTSGLRGLTLSLIGGLSDIRSGRSLG
jgi:hypothetical protein